MASNVEDLFEPHFQSIRIPQHGDKVFKDECAFSFDTPESATGLYVCLNTFVGVGHDYLNNFISKTGSKVFLHLLKIKHVIPQEKAELEPEKKVTRLAIGLEGGFSLDAEVKYEIEEKNKLVIFPGPIEFPLPCPNLPLQVESSILGILSAQSASYLEELSALESTWDGEARRVSKYAENLEQLNNGVKVLPHGWQCSKCDKMDNLWLNLSDGTVLCGRKFFDGTGGNNHALEHFNSTGYPLAVKLGTIGDGKADVYSYAEDDMVEDPLLKQHLAHFGINMEGLKKTDKSMAELEIDLNQRVGEWADIQETGKLLVPLFGPGCTGLSNLGNSCYLNSVVQVLFTVPSFQQRYFHDAPAIFSSTGINAWQDFNVQMAKLACGLLSGRYSERNASAGSDQHQSGIKPGMFKSLVGKGHPEFSTKHQQDVVEFLLHLINVTERHVRNHPISHINPAESFKFRVEERLQCGTSGQVRYTSRSEYHLPVPVPIETASNLEEVHVYEEKKKAAQAAGQPLKSDEVVRPKVTLQACLQALIRQEEVQNFYSSAIDAKTTALKCTRLVTFPEYLWIQLRKFTLAEDWTPRKMDVAVEIPQTLDISWMKSSGQQNGEILMPDQSSGAGAVEPVFDMDIVASLTEMGFPVEACKKAAILTHGRGLESATQWLVEHLDDPDILAPLAPTITPGSFKPNEEGVSMLQAMGFSRSQCIKALQNTDNNVERAADWIFSHPDEINSEDISSSSAPLAEEPLPINDGLPNYELAAFISHMGTSTNVGHYVCHIKKEGRWVIFNDEKVAVSENPPFELGYLYLYRRLSQ